MGFIDNRAMAIPAPGAFVAGAGTDVDVLASTMDKDKTENRTKPKESERKDTRTEFKKEEKMDQVMQEKELFEKIREGEDDSECTVQTEKVEGPAKKTMTNCVKEDLEAHKVEGSEDEDTWFPLLRAVACSRTDAEMTDNGLYPLAMGFANRVCRSTLPDGESIVIKSYTELVLLRVDRDAIGLVDLAAGKAGIGPRVHHSSDRGLITEFVPGRTLQEADMHKGDVPLLRAVAETLATLHQMPVPLACEGEPMLWRTIDKMMRVVARRPDLLPPEGLPSLENIFAEISVAKAALRVHKPTVVLGHGDFKPSNVIADDEGHVTLIDFEVAGPNYRGFDLLKAFRTALPFSESSLDHVLGAYAERTACLAPGSGVAKLKAEARIFEPLTWLEAAVFFWTLPQFKPEETPRWHALGVDRWKKYTETRGRLIDVPQRV
jgi:thiamine kinase-like enzyme